MDEKKQRVIAGLNEMMDMIFDDTNWSKKLKAAKNLITALRTENEELKARFKVPDELVELIRQLDDPLKDVSEWHRSNKASDIHHGALEIVRKLIADQSGGE